VVRNMRWVGRQATRAHDDPARPVYSTAARAAWRGCVPIDRGIGCCWLAGACASWTAGSP